MSTMNGMKLFAFPGSTIDGVLLLVENGESTHGRQRMLQGTAKDVERIGDEDVVGVEETDVVPPGTTQSDVARVRRSP